MLKAFRGHGRPRKIRSGPDPQCSGTGPDRLKDIRETYQGRVPRIIPKCRAASVWPRRPVRPRPRRPPTRLGLGRQTGRLAGPPEAVCHRAGRARLRQGALFRRGIYGRGTGTGDAGADLHRGAGRPDGLPQKLRGRFPQRRAGGSRQESGVSIENVRRILRHHGPSISGRGRGRRQAA
jgi:hypothetical protein